MVVVSRDLERAVAVPQIAATLQRALDDWAACAPQLEAVAGQLDAGTVEGNFAFEPAAAAAPLHARLRSGSMAALTSIMSNWSSRQGPWRGDAGKLLATIRWCSGRVGRPARTVRGHTRAR
ncbi:MAG: hypothetical protein U5K76_08340 [Woeseiaceae bacterium]|nr:hypothetical protein [Woeseiaceae bacterium]